MNLENIEPGSFRDRHGRIVYDGDSVYRVLSRQALDHWHSLQKTKFYAKESEAGHIVGSQEVMQNVPAPWAGALQHEKIPFVSYPYEWPFSMLKDAALLHLRLLEAALAEDMILKDSSAYNVQFKGARAVFIDVSSFEVFATGDPWVGYHQFCQLFLYPLMLASYKQIPFHGWLRGQLDGISAEFCNNLLTKRDLFRSGAFLHVYMQAKAQARYSDTRREIKTDLKSAGFHKALIENNVRKLRKIIGNLNWKGESSEWSHYSDSHSYSEANQAEKEAFITEAAKQVAASVAWDIGCNTGHYARLLAEHSEHVVAMDLDHLAVERLYRQLKAESNTKILPLVMNLADYSPDLGWRGKERKAITARGNPQLIIALALIHHMVIGAHIPLAEFIGWLRGMNSAIVIEFVGKSDEMVKTLLQNKEDVYDDYTKDGFETILEASFKVEKEVEVKPGKRWLYFALPR